MPQLPHRQGEAHTRARTGGNKADASWHKLQRKREGEGQKTGMKGKARQARKGGRVNMGGVRMNLAHLARAGSRAHALRARPCGYAYQRTPSGCWYATMIYIYPPSIIFPLSWVRLVLAAILIYGERVTYCIFLHFVHFSYQIELDFHEQSWYYSLVDRGNTAPQRKHLTPHQKHMSTNKYSVYIILPETGHWRVGAPLDSWVAGRLMRDIARTGRTCYATTDSSEGVAIAVCFGTLSDSRPCISRPLGLRAYGLPAARLANV